MTLPRGATALTHHYTACLDPYSGAPCPLDRNERLRPAPDCSGWGELTSPATPSSDLPPGGSANDRERGAAGLRVANCRALARGGVLLPSRGLREAGQRERPRHL